MGRKIVELEVENRGLKAEMEDLRGREPLPGGPTSPFGGDSLESSAELRRHLQFVEEEAELLRRSISEIEDHNRQLTHELSKFKFEPRPEPGWLAGGGGRACYEWQWRRVTEGQGLVGKHINSLLWARALCPWMGRSVRAGAADHFHVCLEVLFVNTEIPDSRLC